MKKKNAQDNLDFEKIVGFLLLEYSKLSKDSS